MHQHYIFTYSTVLYLLEVHLTKKSFDWESPFHCLMRPFKNLNHLRRLWISNESSLVRKFNRPRMCILPVSVSPTCPLQCNLHHDLKQGKKWRVEIVMSCVCLAALPNMTGCPPLAVTVRESTRCSKFYSGQHWAGAMRKTFTISSRWPVTGTRCSSIIQISSLSRRHIVKSKGTEIWELVIKSNTIDFILLRENHKLENTQFEGYQSII